MGTQSEEDALAAEQLMAAARAGVAGPPVRQLFDRPDVATGYRVQALLTEAAVAGGRRPVGRKIGLTSPAVQRQLGVDQPDTGVLFADMEVPPGASVPAGRLIQPRVEAEVAFVLGADLDGDVGYQRARDAVEVAVAALEIVDSRVAGWDITIVDTVADNASCGLFVLGDRRVDPTGVDLTRLAMTLVDGTGAIVSEGSGAACLGDPVNALVWLARTAVSLGRPLRAGEIVLTGALGPMVDAEPGSWFRADIDVLGSVAVQFEPSPAGAEDGPVGAGRRRSDASS